MAQVIGSQTNNDAMPILAVGAQAVMQNVTSCVKTFSATVLVAIVVIISAVAVAKIVT